MRKIALVGTSSTGIAAPFHDPSWEIWGVSAKGAHVTRADRWFELHRLDGEPPAWAAAWRKKLSEDIGDTPLYMIYPEPLAKNVRQLDTARLADRFGTYFMTSSFAWMMAQAIHELRPLDAPPEDGHIAIYGVEMEYGTEYRQQRAGFRHFIDIAKFAGIHVTRLADGGLAYEPVPYPMWQDDPLMAKLAARQHEAKTKLDSFYETQRVTVSMMDQQRAVIDLLSKDFDKTEQLALATKRLNALQSTSAKLSKDIVKLEGHFEEQSWLSDYLQP